MSAPPPADYDEEDEVIEDVLRHAEPRRQPSVAARDRAYHTLHDEWLVMTRRRWQRNIVYGIAASLIVALTIGLLIQQPPTPAIEFAVLRISGDTLAVNGTPVSTDNSTAIKFEAGDYLSSGPASRLAASWNETGSLRVDENTRVEFVSNDTIRLLQGAVYYDSRSFGHDNESPAMLRIETPHGLITHRGTQFLVSIDGAAISVSVREGEVHVESQRVDVAAAAGETLLIGTDGYFERSRIEPYAARWKWAAEVAPTQLLAGRSPQSILDWIGRETGRTIVYRSDRARLRAIEKTLVGLGELGPNEAARAIPILASSLHYEINEARIVVDVRDTR